MLGWPKKLGRRSQELRSGFAAAELAAVWAELSTEPDAASSGSDAGVAGARGVGLALGTEEERWQLRDPRGYAGPLATSAVSSVGVFHLARCVAIARCGHVAHSARNRLLGVAVALPYFAMMFCATGYYRYAEVLDSVLCPGGAAGAAVAIDTPLARHLRQRGMPLAPPETLAFLKACEERCSRSQALEAPS
eukprot:TRINITY_DN212_c1_g1_i4.p1 TRINITY_DN212_c1_g1~~TRINITY_DN212_c1_g1_i4.p1  ORF type:complete len:192 (+),score=42.09 TRINITY_DN212_c1_g1_i4:96-671(+)